jgi:hypothetical protein
LHTTTGTFWKRKKRVSLFRLEYRFVTVASSGNVTSSVTSGVVKEGL